MKVCKKIEPNTCNNKKTSGGHNESFFSSSTTTCAKLANKKELCFYNFAIKNKLSILDYMPVMHSLCVMNGKPYIELENLKAGMKSPHELDIKLGKHSADYQDLRELGMNHFDAFMKATRMRSANVITELTDYKWSPRSRDFVGVPHQLVFSEYFNCSSGDLARAKMILEVKKIIDAMKELLTMRIHGMSILFIYDRDQPSNVRVKLIDFAHATSIMRKNDSINYIIAGLESLLVFMQLH